ncbi:MAG: hypothetical protein VST70_00590 [Nitrospirota bacterium]|nr:hypothetical protein [Nitrospirota bacterium]
MKCRKLTLKHLCFQINSYNKISSFMSSFVCNTNFFSPLKRTLGFTGNVRNMNTAHVISAFIFWTPPLLYVQGRPTKLADPAMKGPRRTYSHLSEGKKSSRTLNGLASFYRRSPHKRGYGEVPTTTLLVQPTRKTGSLDSGESRCGGNQEFLLIQQRLGERTARTGP